MLEMTMRDLLHKLGLSRWQSLTWAKRLQGAAWALVAVTAVVAAVLVLSGCSAQQAKATADGLTATRAEVAAAVARADEMQAAAEQTAEENRTLVERLRQAEAAARAAGDQAAEAQARAGAEQAGAAVAKAQAEAKAARELKDKAAAVAAKVEQALAALETARGADGSITPEGAIAAGATAAAPLLPGGVGVWVAALTPTVLSLLGMVRAMSQAKAATAAAASVVKSVDVLRLAEPAVAEAMAKNKKLVRAVLTPAAARVVDSTRTT